MTVPRRENKTEQQANIKFCFKLGKIPTRTYEMSKEVYGDDCLFRAQVFEWFARFRNDKRSKSENDVDEKGPSNIES